MKKKELKARLVGMGIIIRGSYSVLAHALGTIKLGNR